MEFVRIFVLCVVTLCLGWGAGFAATPSSPPKQPKQPKPQAKPPAKLPRYLQRAVASQARPASDRRRDAARKPGQVMHFFGIRPGMRVLEMMTGRGYYAELLARAVGPKGKVYAHNNNFVMRRFAARPMAKRLRGKRLPNVVLHVAELDKPKLPAKLDVVLMILFYHDTYWMKADRAKMNKAIFKALKPGGVYGVIDHHAKVGTGAKEVKRLHRVEASLVKKEIRKAGFVLVKQSSLLRNPKDTRSINVFRKAIRGRTDRFVLLFRKPNPKK